MAWTKITKSWLNDLSMAYNSVTALNVKYGYDEFLSGADSSTFKEAVVAWECGFDSLSFDKHSYFDAYDSNTGDCLEIKNTNINTLSGTFNDTTEDKLKAYETEPAFLALGVWNDFDLQYIVFGPMADIVPILRNKLLNSSSNRAGNASMTENELIQLNFERIEPSETYLEI